MSHLKVHGNIDSVTLNSRCFSSVFSSIYFMSRKFPPFAIQCCNKITLLQFCVKLYCIEYALRPFERLLLGWENPLKQINKDMDYLIISWWTLGGREAQNKNSCPFWINYCTFKNLYCYLNTMHELIVTIQGNVILLIFFLIT